MMIIIIIIICTYQQGDLSMSMILTDGHTVDITELAIYSTSKDGVVSVSGNVVTVLQAGGWKYFQMISGFLEIQNKLTNPQSNSCF